MKINTHVEDLYKNKIYRNNGNIEVLNFVPPDALTVLDVGCGAGDNAKILKLQNKIVTGITISEGEAKIASVICDEVLTLNIENQFELIEKKYDVIILSHICEHLRNPSIVIKNLSKNLSAEGLMIIALPNMAFYKNRWKLLIGDWRMQESGPFDKTHLHFYSFVTADDLNNETFLKLYSKIPGMLTIPLWPLRKFLPKFCNKLDKKVGKYFPNLFAQQTILLLRHSFIK